MAVLLFWGLQLPYLVKHCVHRNIISFCGPLQIIHFCKPWGLIFKIDFNVDMHVNLMASCKIHLNLSKCSLFCLVLLEMDFDTWYPALKPTSLSLQGAVKICFLIYLTFVSPMRWALFRLWSNSGALKGTASVWDALFWKDKFPSADSSTDHGQITQMAGSEKCWSR